MMIGEQLIRRQKGIELDLMKKKNREGLKIESEREGERERERERQRERESDRALRISMG